MLTRGEWQPRSTAFLVMEIGLGWISASYGLNLVFSSAYRNLVTPATLEAIESVAPLYIFGYSLIVGAILLAVGFIGRWPLWASAGHLVMAVLFAALGVSVFQITPLNQVFLVMGIVLHPTMATALARDGLGKPQARKEIGK